MRKSITKVRVARKLAKTVPAFFSRLIKRPFFIIGCGRSGTSVLSRTLGEHPEIALYPGEANNLWHPNVYPWLDCDLPVPPPWEDPERYAEKSLLYRSERDALLLKAAFGAYQIFHGNRTFLQKSALITFLFHYLLALFPDARFIHIIRDGRSVAASGSLKIFKQLEEAPEKLARKGRMITPEEDLLVQYASYWVKHIERMDRYKSDHRLIENGLLHEFKYEDFCRDPVDHLRAISAFMDVDPSFFEKNDYTHITSANNKRNRLSPAQLDTLTEMMEETLALKGYPV